MGQGGSKIEFRKIVVQLYEPVSAKDELWEVFFKNTLNDFEIFSLLSSADLKKIKKTNNLKILLGKAINFLSSTKLEASVELSNSIRIITRLMPYVFEDPDLEKSVFNGNDLGNILISAAFKVLFVPGYTVGEDIKEDESPIWESGVGCSEAPSGSAEIHKNRFEAVRFLLALFSKVVYYPPERFDNSWLREFVSQEEDETILTILCSLLNTVMNYDPYGWVPYNYVVFNDSKERLVQSCAQLLVVILSYEYGLSSFLESPEVAGR
jgi:hypothetical protein